MALPILPHREPLLLIKDVIACNEEVAEVRAQVSTDSPACANGWIRPGYLVEVAAQAAAAQAAEINTGHESIASRQAPQAVLGYLVALADWRWHHPVSSGTLIDVRVRPGRALGSLREYSAELRVQGLLVAAGRLQIAQSGPVEE